MSRTYRRNSDEQVDAMRRADDKRKQNARTWARRAKDFADNGDYDLAIVNMAQAALVGRPHNGKPGMFA